MDVVRQDSSVRVQEYDFHVGDKEGWGFVYNKFQYPSEDDKPVDAVSASLTIEERHPNRFPSRDCPGDTAFFSDIIYELFDGSVARRTDWLLYSPALSELKKEPKRLEDIRRNLSDEAKELLDRGLEGYNLPRLISF